MKNREIKFRIWLGDRYKQYPQGDKRCSHSPCMYGNIGEIGVLEFQQRENYVIQQYTGLKDTNGEEIYEGDILERIGNGSFCKIVVSWSDKECCFVHNNVNNLHGSPSPLHDNFVNLCDWTYWIVCGNIFDNPELLK